MEKLKLEDFWEGQLDRLGAALLEAVLQAQLEERLSIERRQELVLKKTA